MYICRNRTGEPGVIFPAIESELFGQENEAFKAVAPYMKRMFRATTDFFVRAGDKLGNMNGRQEQFAISFQGVISHYILVMDERGVSAEQLGNPHAIWELVRQFMYGIYS